MCVPHVQHVPHYFFSSFSQSFHLCSGRCRRPCLLGSFKITRRRRSENFFWKWNLAFLQSFLNYSKSLRLQSVFYPGIKLKPALQGLEGKIDWNFVIICSRCSRRRRQQRHHKFGNLTMKNSRFGKHNDLNISKPFLSFRRRKISCFSVVFPLWPVDHKFSILFSYLWSAYANLIPGYLEHNLQICKHNDLESLGSLRSYDSSCNENVTLKLTIFAIIPCWSHCTK